MLSRVIKIVVILGMLAGLAWGGVCVYANFFNKSSEVGGTQQLPGIEKAAYSVSIKNTHNLLLTDKYEQSGTVYTLHGYWEYTGSGFKYRDATLSLDEQVFGEIIVKRR